MIHNRRIFSQRRLHAATIASLSLVGASIFALLVAWWTQHIRGVVPCELCFIERWPWRVALAAGLIGLLLPGLSVVTIALGLFALLVSVLLSILHSGVEFGLWPSPFPSCHAPVLSIGSITQRLASMPMQAAKPCDAPTFLFDWLPVSMTTLGGFFAFIVMLFIIYPLNRRR